MRADSFRTVLAMSLGSWLASAVAASAHPFQITEIDIGFRSQGTYEVDITYHIDAMLAEVPDGELTEEQYAMLRSMPDEERRARLEMVRGYFQVMVGLRFDGETVTPEVSFPLMEAPERPKQDAILPGHWVRLTGAVPDGAREFVLAPAPVFNTIALRIRQEGSEGVFEQLLDPVEESKPYLLDQAPTPTRRLAVAGQYLVLGVEHIVPKGLDHILFVLGLYLLSVRFGPLLLQVTAFTLAHTMTLALSTYGVLSLPSSVVEPLIALSIAYVAVENLFTTELKPWRPAVVFAFGLLHGLGFAGVLLELGLPRERFLTALLSFNAGVEIGQLIVIAAAFAATVWFRERSWYRAGVVVPASVAIALVGLYWAVERAFG